MRWAYDAGNRAGDHIWWISDTRKFERDYPAWSRSYPLDRVIQEMHQVMSDRS